MKQFNLWLAVIAAGIFGALPGWAEAPAGYYSTCEGKKGAALLSALCDKIGPHTNVGYDGLWNVYKTSDVRPNGKVWDMYSTKQWTVGQQKCGNYKYVGDCINREHSMPKSWFSEGQPMKSDAFHVYPTDGKVNGQRSNYPYGECAGGTTLPPNGNVVALGRLGRSTFAGYSGTVFEPDDEYKGDFARTYFYMAACYNDKIAGWNSDMLAGNRYPAYTTWAVNLLLKWHRQDPVSQKEIDRNDAVYAHQHNRNPFIDHPEMAEHIWGTDKETGWSSTGTAKPSIASPTDGSAIDFGNCGIGVERTYTVTVKGQNLVSDVAVCVTGLGHHTVGLGGQLGRRRGTRAQVHLAHRTHRHGHPHADLGHRPLGADPLGQGRRRPPRHAGHQRERDIVPSQLGLHRPRGHQLYARRHHRRSLDTGLPQARGRDHRAVYGAQPYPLDHIRLHPDLPLRDAQQRDKRHHRRPGALDTVPV